MQEPITELTCYNTVAVDLYGFWELPVCFSKEELLTYLTSY